jgi:non-homologous end joining protein Ku
VSRSIWTGSISFGLVNVPVRASTAVTDHDVHFHQRVVAHEPEWDPKRYRDTFTDELTERILAKDKGKDVVEEAGPTEPSADVVDLVAALEASVQGAKEARRQRRRASTKRKSA